MPAKMAQTGIHQGDCLERLAALPPGKIDLAFADPPFNIGYDYDVYDDRQESEAYLDWSKKWLAGVHRVLKPSGTFWLAIGDEYAAELKLASQEVGFHCRSWVVWYYTFGVNCKYKFSRSHAHLFYFVKDRNEFTFRSDAPENRIPSARQLVYGDGRANPHGRLPDDTWVLRPQDLAGCLSPDEDTWYLPRVAGTFKERAGFHGCQMPEQLLGRIIRLCSQPGELVLDPFSGSATTAAVAKKLGRRYLAFDLSAEYVARGQSRLHGIRVGDPLDGAAEPTLSAPATPKNLNGKKRAAQVKGAGAQCEVSPHTIDQVQRVQEGLLEAFRRTYDGYSLDRLVADPEMNARFAGECRQLGLPGEERTWNWTLFGMRKGGLLAGLPAERRTEISWQDCGDYLFASEIAWRQMLDQHRSESLDKILCDPFLAAEFDHLAARWAPGHTPLEYRWAAIRLRKSSSQIRARAQVLTDVKFGDQHPLAPGDLRKLPEQPAVYLVAAESRPDELLYVGEADNLRQRLQKQFGVAARPAWRSLPRTLFTRYFPTACSSTDRLAYQHRVALQHRPRLNLAGV